SRRRHTRLQGDWSSDVCSSDLPEGVIIALGVEGECTRQLRRAIKMIHARFKHEPAQILSSQVEIKRHVCQAVVRRSIVALGLLRSEERRVGKECRSRLVGESGR